VINIVDEIEHIELIMEEIGRLLFISLNINDYNINSSIKAQEFSLSLMINILDKSRTHIRDYLIFYFCDYNIELPHLYSPTEV
jgi:hypothetical protein